MTRSVPCLLTEFEIIHDFNFNFIPADLVIAANWSALELWEEMARLSTTGYAKTLGQRIGARKDISGWSEARTCVE